MSAPGSDGLPMRADSVVVPAGTCVRDGVRPVHRHGERRVRDTSGFGEMAALRADAVTVNGAAGLSDVRRASTKISHTPAAGAVTDRSCGSPGQEPALGS